MHPDSFGTFSSKTVGGRAFGIFRLEALEKRRVGKVSRLPFSIKVLLENLLRHEDGATVTADDVRALANWSPKEPSDREIAFRPARVLLQDFTGVPALVDLAAMRDAAKRMGGDPKRINPLMPADLVIDHSVQVDRFAAATAFPDNVAREYGRNGERYAFLRWGKESFRNFRVVPPGTGICHQVNLEHLAPVVFTRKDRAGALAYPDTLVGTDSHTPMINGLGVVGWGVGGIEAEAAMLGQPISMLIPEVVGFRMTGELPVGATATDLVLTVVQMLRKKGVVGKFVEFYGKGLSSLSVADRATISNMSPEYGATIGFFPVDRETLSYLRFTGRDGEQVKLVEAYCKAQGLFRTDETRDPVFSDTLSLDLSTVEPCMAGPRRPQDRVPLKDARDAFRKALSTWGKEARTENGDDGADRWMGEGGGAAGRNPRSGNGSLDARDDVGPARPGGVRPARRLGGDRRHHELHEHLQPLRDDRRGAGGEEGGREGAADAPVGEDEPRPGVEGGDAIPRSRGADAVSAGARVPPGRIRLHHLHRKLRAPPGGDRGDDPARKPGRRVGPVGEPELRGTDPPAMPGELPRLPDARGGVRPRRGRRLRPVHRAAGQRQERKAGLPPRDLAVAGGDHRGGAVRGRTGDVPQGVRLRVLGGRGVEEAPRPEVGVLRMGTVLHLRQEPAVLREPAGGAGTGRGDPRRAGPRGARRLGDDGPHLPRRRHRRGRTRGSVPERPRHPEGGVQLLRKPAGKSRGDDAGHLRQHPAEEPPRPGDGRRLDHVPARRGKDDDLRRGDAVRRRKGPR